MFLLSQLVQRSKLPVQKVPDLRLEPAYPVSDAAHYLRMPAETLRSWVSGRLYPAGGRMRRSKPLIILDDAKGRYLSFTNLVGAHVLAAIRRRHGVQLPKVRRALDYLQHSFGVVRPLIDLTFQTDGLNLFVERYGQMINASRAGQQAMKDIIGVYLQRVERDRKGFPIRFYPFTRDADSEEALRSDPKVIVMAPSISFGRPVVAGTGTPVSAIYERYKAGDSIAELVRSFRLEASDVEEAIRCEAA